MNVKENRNMWRMLAITFIILSFFFIILIIIMPSSKEIINKEITFYEIANYTNEWSEQYVDEEGYVRINTTKYSYIDRGIKIESPCECFEELCPFGSHWQDGSKICYDKSKQMGIVEGVGCRIYVCDKFMLGVN